MGSWKQKMRQVEDEEDWKRVMRVGKGACGSVSLAVASKDGFRFAVKSAPRNTAAALDLHNETALLQAMAGCPNIIRCLGWSDLDLDEDGIAVFSLFLEFMRHGSLEDLISRRGPLSEAHARVYTHAVVRALHYMHSHGVVHGDVKCGNVLLHSTREVKESVVRLADLGFGKRLQRGSRLQEEEEEAGSGAHEHVKPRGTWSHMAPELHCEGGRYKPGLQLSPSDIWSLGCAVVSMVQGFPPWGTGLQAITNQLQGARPLLPTHISADCRDFIIKCLQPDPSSRWTSQQLLHHPFLVPPCLHPPPRPLESLLRGIAERVMALLSRCPNVLCCSTGLFTLFLALPEREASNEASNVTAFCMALA